MTEYNPGCDCYYCLQESEARDRKADTHPRIAELRQQGVRPYIELD